MSAINGKQYVERINQLKANVWVDGKLVTGDITMNEAINLFWFRTSKILCFSCYYFSYIGYDKNN
ncbi:hypothetical protein [Priestia megaterium]|uniref:hypothetical protein n=1 Tax=Priestia megaterium TaxID=1404 RepID=UPI002864AA5D|nr:hypothetical protein [Priestia megaterium]MDR7241585.1 hypothetical protein [Priestia megaterium]